LKENAILSITNQNTPIQPEAGKNTNISLESNVKSSQVPLETTINNEINPIVPEISGKSSSSELDSKLINNKKSLKTQIKNSDESSEVETNSKQENEAVQKEN